MQNQTRKSLIADVAQALQMPVSDVPGDLCDPEVDKIFGLARGTTTVKRSRGDFPVPSYKIGRSRRTPLSSIIDFKLKQIEENCEAA